MSAPGNATRADPGGRLKWRIVGWLSVLTAALLVAGSLTAYGLYRHLSGNMRQHDVLEQLGDERPDKAGGVENILLIGSDTRAGQGDAYGADVSGARSDTLILLHLSADRDKAVLVSFPRDSIVQIPSCQGPEGTVVRPHTGMINEAFAIGPACTWRTVESLTGIRIDHFVQIDFSGFRHMVDALGGVEICLPQAVNDPKAELTMPAGRHVVGGKEALGYVRMRYGLGDGSDLERIKRQQRFMAAMIKKATSTRLLFDPPRLYGFLDAATRSVSTDRGLGLPDLRRIAESVKGMDTGEVTFSTVPTTPAPSDPNRLTFHQPAADQLFEAISTDSQLPSSGSSAEPGSAVPPSQVQVRVLNGTEIGGLAGRTADALRAQGFQVVDVGNTETPTGETVVRHAQGAQPQASAVADVVPGARTAPAATAADAVELVIGGDWQGLDRTGDGPGEPGGPGGGTAGPDTPSPVDTMTAAENICARN